MGRHMTVSGFVVHGGEVALHWHRKAGAWLPAGGHMEPGEDPIEATIREVREEFDLDTEIIEVHPRIGYAGGPAQLEPPYTLLLCYLPPDHEHVDMVYFLRVLSGFPGRSYDADYPIVWVDADRLRRGSLAVTPGDDEVAIPPDVQALGLEAIRLAMEASSRPTTLSRPA